jgi:hypothetical protein
VNIVGNIQTRITMRSRIKNGLNKLKKPFLAAAKTTVFISTLGLLGTGCGEPVGFPINEKADSGTKAPMIKDAGKIFDSLNKTNVVQEDSIKQDNLDAEVTIDSHSSDIIQSDSMQPDIIKQDNMLPDSLPIDSSPVDKCALSMQSPCIINQNTCASLFPTINGHEYIIVTRPKFITSLLQFINGKCAEQMMYLTTVEQISAHFNGQDSPEKIRNYLKYAKQNGAKYVLLVGDTDYGVVENGSLDYNVDKDWEVPMRYANVLGKPYALDDTIIPTDQYYASLDGSWDDNGNGIFGEAGSKDEFSFKPDLYVGRFPVRTQQELDTLIKSTLGWVVKKKPTHSGFVSAGCLGGFGYENFLKNSLFAEAQNLKTHTCNSDSGGDIAYYLNQDSADMMSSFSHGYHNAIGASYGYYLTKSSQKINKPTLFFVYACETTAIDFKDDSIAEFLLKNGSSVAYIGSTRSHEDDGFNFWEGVYFGHNFELGKALFEYKYYRSSNRILERVNKENLLMFNLMGDPSLRLYKPQVELVMPEYVDLKSSNWYIKFKAQVENKKSYPLDIEILDKGVYNFLYKFKAMPLGLGSVYLDAYTDPSVRFTFPKTYVVIDQDGDASFARTKLIRYHEIVIPKSFSYVKAGQVVNMPVKILYGIDEVIEITGDYYPGYYGQGMATPNQIFSYKVDLAKNRSLNLSFTMPANNVPFDPQKIQQLGPYHFPMIIVKSDKGVVSEQFISIRYSK